MGKIKSCTSLSGMKTVHRDDAGNKVGCATMLSLLAAAVLLICLLF